MESQVFNVFVGAETGLLKGVNTKKNTWCNINSIDQASRNLEIKNMCWGDDSETELCVGLRNQTVCVFNTNESEITSTHNFSGSEKDIFAGLEKIQGLFLTCTQSGLLKLWNEDDTPQLQLSLGENIGRVRKNPLVSHTIASGGEENDLKIWDLQKPTEPIFKAKNVRNDWLNLRVPVHIKDIAFLPNSEKICTCTAHNQVRLYDPSASQRRPVLDMEWGEYPVTALSLHNNGYQAVVGNTHGDMALIDLRKKGHSVHCYKGVAGAIRDIKCHSSQDTVASCGLDRFLRIHNIKDKSLISKYYLKSRLNCLLFASSSVPEDAHSNGHVLESENMQHKSEKILNDNTDDIWDTLTVVKTKTLKRKIEQSSDNIEIDESSEHLPHKSTVNDRNSDNIVTDSLAQKKKKKNIKQKTSKKIFK